MSDLGTYDTGDVAAKLKASTRHVRRLADGGRMPPPFHVGRLVRWNRSTIDNWLAAGCPPVRSAKKGGRA